MCLEVQDREGCVRRRILVHLSPHEPLARPCQGPLTQAAQHHDPPTGLVMPGSIGSGSSVT